MTADLLKENVLSDLKESALEIERICNQFPAELKRRKPAPDKWSVLDVLCHLSDTERLIFRHRFLMFLQDESREPYFPDIDHTPWEKLHRYDERDPDAALADFLMERDETISMIQPLAEAKLNLKGLHEIRGIVTFHEIASYCAKHTRVHVEQIKRTLAAVE